MPEHSHGQLNFYCLTAQQYLNLGKKQGWEFAHRFSERIARFLRNNEQMSDSLKKTSDLLKQTSDSLIRSCLVSDLSNSLMVAHIW